MMCGDRTYISSVLPVNHPDCKCFKKSLKIPKGGNQNPHIEEQTTQWPKDKGQTTIYKTYTYNLISNNYIYEPY